jgi:O-antigen ligase
MSIGIILLVALAADETRRRALRAAACAATVPLAVALFLTFSRGALVALLAGFIGLVLSRPTRSTLLAGAITLAGGALFAGALELFPAVLELKASPGERTGEGAVVAALLVLATVGAAFAFDRLEQTAALRRPLAIAKGARRAIAVVGVVAVIGVGAAITFGPERTDPLPSSKERITQLTNNRGDYWRVALRSWSAHPVAGVGAGSFSVEWRRERESREFALDAHSLYLETLDELGVVGAVLLAAFIAAVALAAVRRVRDSPDPLVAAAIGVLLAVVVHVGLDWTWEFPAVILVALILAAAVLGDVERAPA